MSMLAEPRRKQKWSVDPRNSTWSNDDSKFGQKMLERMGWSKGKGLGKSEQGSTDHLKVKLKNNNHGLGATASYEDNWIAHQDDFNELLAQLNNCHGQNGSSSSAAPSEEQRSFSLEEKSKTSKKRVHYMKFTKGKDLSSRSETDLNCIFGKRARSSRDSEQEGGSRDSPCEEEALADPESITKTVTSTLTMQEYFAQRMASLKKARAQGAPSGGSSPVQTSDPEPDEPKKKKKKKRAETGEVEGTEDGCGQVFAEDQQPSKKKKKRRKNEDDTTTEISCATSGVEENCDEAPPSKKKKNKKHKEIMDEQINGHELTESLTEKSKKKKKKRREETSDAV
ncbi:PIN2/TERF1-interacting telomerase inhibitor 1 [Neosynchiropus ocellatus]